MNENHDLELNVACLKQEIEKLKNKLKQQETKCNEYQLQHEIAKEEQAQLAQELTDLQSNKNKESEFDNRERQLEQDLSALRNNFSVEAEQQDNTIKVLEEKLELLKNEDVDVQDESFKDIEENLQLENILQNLSDELYNKQSVLQMLEESKLKLMENNEGLQRKLEEVTLNFECKKAELLETREMIKNSEDEKIELTLEIVAAKANSIKPAKNEDSLFGEVNERRLKMRDELISQDEKCKQLNAELSKVHKHMTSLKLHNHELTKLLKTQPEENQEEYETLTDVYLKRISVLEELQSIYQEALRSREKLLAKNSYQNVEEFIKTVTERFMKDANKLKDMAGMEFRAQKMMSFRLREIELEIQKFKNLTTEMHEKIFKMRDYLEKQKLALNSSTQDNESTNNGINSCTFLEESKDDKKENISSIVENDKIKKKVMFSAEATMKPSSSHVVRRGAKVIQAKPKHISSKK